MASAALKSFNAAVDSSSLGFVAKAQIKVLGEGLYQAAVREHLAHLAKHLDADLASSTNPDDQRVIALLSAVAESFASNPDIHLSDISAFLTRGGEGEMRWIGGLPVLFNARTKGQAESIFDALLARAPASNERIATRLTVLRDLITEKVAL